MLVSHAGSKQGEFESGQADSSGGLDETDEALGFLKYAVSEQNASVALEDSVGGGNGASDLERRAGGGVSVPAQGPDSALHTSVEGFPKHLNRAGLDLCQPV